MAPCINCSTDETWYVCEIPYCHWKAWMHLRATVRAAKPENHIYCSYSKQAATNTQVLILMRSWMLCLLPKWLLEYFVGFALLGQKLTSRVVHMKYIFRNVDRGVLMKPSEQFCFSLLLVIPFPECPCSMRKFTHITQDSSFLWACSTLQREVILCTYQISISLLFRIICSLHHLGHISPPSFLTSTQS